MGLFSSLAGLFKPSETPKEEVSDCCVSGQCVCGQSSSIAEADKILIALEEEEVSDCCVSGQCVCGQSSSIEDEDVPSAPVETTNVVTVTDTSAISTTLSNFDTTVTAAMQSQGLATTTSSTSGDVKPILVSEAAPIEKLRPVIKNEVIVKTQVEESSKEEKPIQLKLDLSDTVETKAPDPVVTAPILSPSKASTKNRIRKNKLKKGRKKNK